MIFLFFQTTFAGSGATTSSQTRREGAMATSAEATMITETPSSIQKAISPEPEAQRGRQRRRSPAPFGTIVPTKAPSGESATLRGRRRYRSTSVIPISALSSRNPSRNVKGSSRSRSPRRAYRFTQFERRRSASPSRSHSPNAADTSNRRRQRTRSRGRNHRDHDSLLPVAEFEMPLRADLEAGSQNREPKENGDP